MRRGFKALGAVTATVLIVMLSLNVRADSNIEAQGEYLKAQVNDSVSHSKVKSSELEAQKKALFEVIDRNVEKALADQKAHEELFETQRINNIIADSRNYASYLRARTTNLADNTRIKKEILDNYRSISAYNPQMGALIPQALADYEKAVMEETYGRCVADAAEMFVNGPLIEQYAKQALDSYSGSQDAGSFVMRSIGVSTVY